MAVNRWGLVRDIPNGSEPNIHDHVSLDASLPSSISNRINYMKDQRQHGSCTGFARERVIRMALKKLGLPDIDLSPLMAYYDNRIESGLPATQDSGASISGSISAGKKYGLCRESYWTYANADGYLFVKPESYAYQDGSVHQILEAYSVPNNTDSIRQALAAGFGITYGTTVHYNSFENTPNGDVQMPQSNDSIAGAHNIVLDGYDDSMGRFTFGNSWGERWGNKGFGTIPYEHIQRFGFDLWVVKLVESPTPVPVKHNASITSESGITVVDDVKTIKVDGSQIWPL